MTLYCNDCSYRGKTSGQGGKCPACGSYNLTRGQPKPDEASPAKWRLVLLVGLWTYLFALIIWKLLS